MTYGSYLIVAGGGSSGGGGAGWNPENKITLEQIREQDDKLTFKGELVGEPSRETSLVVVLTQGIIAQGYLELPADCDTREGQPVVILYGGVNPEKGRDWELVLNEWPAKDRISWAGKSLATVLMAGTEFTVTYYKKL